MVNKPGLSGGRRRKKALRVIHSPPGPGNVRSSWLIQTSPAAGPFVVSSRRSQCSGFFRIVFRLDHLKTLFELIRLDRLEVSFDEL
jgi:hypothetical protein